MKPELERFIPVVDAITSTFHGISEVVLHDLSIPESSVVYISGELTDRKLGSPSTTLVLNTLKTEGDKARDIIAYITKGPDGRALKSSTIFIRNENGKIVGCMCINIDITSIILLSNFLNSLTEISSPLKEVTEINEHFANDINEITEVLIQDAAREVGKPIELMDKDEKTRIVCILEKKGLFLVKGAINKVAKTLQVSKYTVYNYLDDIRNNSDDME